MKTRLNLIERGRNYGWPTLEGFCNTREEEAYCAANDVVEPLHTWSPTVGIAGAEVYIGDAHRGMGWRPPGCLSTWGVPIPRWSF